MLGELTNDIRLSNLPMEVVWRFSGNTKIHCNVPDDTQIVVMDGRLDIEGSLGNNVKIELKSKDGLKSDDDYFQCDVYIKGGTGKKCLIQISEDILGNVTIKDKLGDGSQINARGLTEVREVGDNCKIYCNTKSYK